MADNVAITPGSGATVAADEIGGVIYQRVKVQHGADGSATDVSTVSPLPVGHLADLDSGAGGDNKGAVGVLLAASGGGVPAPGDATFGIDTDVTRMPAAARTTDSVSSALATDVVMNDLTALTPKFFSSTVSAGATDTVLVAAVTSKKIRVLKLSITCSGTATAVTLESDEAGDVRKHKVNMGINGVHVLPGGDALGWFETASGSALLATTGAGSDIDITGVYVEV